uniref:Bile salt-activated lipase-like n=1 Tax=Hippocampus comes TaxID=109280 RepID=A0A3Q2YGB3_HIPCM
MGRANMLTAVTARVGFVTTGAIACVQLGVVQTESGRVQGTNKGTGLFTSVDVFKGIPFADTPGLWEKPKPHPGWEGVLKATKYAERCLQVTLLQTQTRGSVDCLYLNIFVPQGLKLSSNLPVMVYLFGGAFLLGASNDLAILGDSLYDGKEMAERGNVIVVSANYRVGTLGFLSSGDARMPGNYGLWDQHAAISWVRRNIAPARLFHNAAEVDYMAGISSMDGHIFAGVDVPSINKKAANTTVEDVRDLLMGLTKEKGAAAVGSAFSVYSAHWGSNPDPAVVKKTVADIETDFLFLVPTQIALQLHANHSSGGRTFSYLFNMKTRIPGFPSWVEAEHSEDLQYVFGKPFATPLVYFPRHRDLSRNMIAYWTNFAKTGDPGYGDSKVPVPWPAFGKIHRPFLTINHKMTKSSVGYDLRQNYVAYWTEMYNTLPSARRPQHE